MSSRNLRIYTHGACLTWLPEHDLGKAGTNRQANVEAGKLSRPQALTSSCRQIGNFEDERTFSPGKNTEFGQSFPRGQL